MTKRNLYDQPQILHLLSQGSEVAFAQFYNQHRAKIYGVALKLLKSKELAEETVQEVFLKIWLKRKELYKINQIDGYLYMIARNHIFDQLKIAAVEAETRNQLPIYLSHENKTDHLVREKQYKKLLDDLINHLPPQQKTVYQLSREEGLNYDDIAQKLNISPFTAKKHMSQALKFIREHIGHLHTVWVFFI